MKSRRNNRINTEGGQARLLPKQREGGQAVFLVVIVLLTVSMMFIARIGRDMLAQSDLVRRHNISQQAAAVAESGLEDLSYRVREGMQFDPVETLDVAGEEVVTTTNSEAGVTSIESEAEVNELIRKKSALFVTGIPANFQYAVQTTGSGGVSINGGNITGNLYSNGSVSGAGLAEVTGDASVSGETNQIDSLTVSGDATADVVSNSIVSGDAYVGDEIISTIVSGETLMGSNLPEETNFNFDEDALYQLKIALSSSGSVYFGPCPYTITGIETLGNFFINCDVIISNNAVVNLTGPVWARGDITISGSPEFRFDSGLGPKGVILIADEPTDRVSKGRIIISGNPTINSGSEGNYLMLRSENEFSAITVSDYVSGNLVLFAPNGAVTLEDDAEVSGIYADSASVNDNSSVNYDTNLGNLIFEGVSDDLWQVSHWAEVE